MIDNHAGWVALYSAEVRHLDVRQETAQEI